MSACNQTADELQTVDEPPASDERQTAKLVNDGVEQPGSRPACDARLLFAARFVRLFAFASMTVVLLLLLAAAGIAGERVGVLLTLVMVGDLGISFFLTTGADRFGRKRTLLVGAALALFAALIFGSSSSFVLLLVAGTIGVVSPGGAEVGPFQAVEQAALADLRVRDGGDVAKVAATFGRYQFVGEAAKALGSLAAGAMVDGARASGADELTALRRPVLLFGGAALLKALLYSCLSSGIEVGGGRRSAGEDDGDRPRAKLCGVVSVGLRPESLPTVLKLSALFAVDSFGGGFTMLTFLSFWFQNRWGLQLASLGGVLAAVNVVAGVSSMAAGCMVRRFGAVETMVFTHLPSNVLLMLVPLMPSAGAAVGMLILRFTISQMDVPARQAYVAMLIDADERSAAGGITTVARSIGLIFSPLLLGPFMAAPPRTVSFDAPFYIAGGVKSVYDVAVWWHFRSVKRARG